MTGVQIKVISPCPAAREGAAWTPHGARTIKNSLGNEFRRMPIGGVRVRPVAHPTAQLAAHARRAQAGLAVERRRIAHHLGERRRRRDFRRGERGRVRQTPVRRQGRARPRRSSASRPPCRRRRSSGSNACVVSAPASAARSFAFARASFCPTARPPSSSPRPSRRDRPLPLARARAPSASRWQRERSRSSRRDGTLLHATERRCTRLGGATTLSALGIEALAATALDSRARKRRRRASAQTPGRGRCAAASRQRRFARARAPARRRAEASLPPRRRALPAKDVNAAQARSIERPQRPSH